jgi:hypothetical protein
VQLVSRLWQPPPPEAAESNELEHGLRRLDAAFVGDPQDVRNRGVLDPLATHAKAVAEFADQAGISELTARLFNQGGCLSVVRGVNSGAELLRRGALASCSSLVQALALPEFEIQARLQSLLPSP